MPSVNIPLASYPQGATDIRSAGMLISKQNAQHLTNLNKLVKGGGQTVSSVHVPYKEPSGSVGINDNIASITKLQNQASANSQFDGKVQPAQMPKSGGGSRRRRNRRLTKKMKKRTRKTRRRRY